MIEVAVVRTLDNTLGGPPVRLASSGCVEAKMCAMSVQSPGSGRSKVRVGSCMSGVGRSRPCHMVIFWVNPYIAGRAVVLFRHIRSLLIYQVNKTSVLAFYGVTKAT